MPRFLPAKIEQWIVWERLHLYNRGLPCGAWAIRLRLNLLGIQPLPSVTSIHRILSRNGLTHGRTGIYTDSNPAITLLPPVGLSS
jgi:putative transposase